MKRVYTMTIAVLVGIISMFSFTAFAQGPPQATNVSLQATSPNHLFDDDIFCTYDLTDATTTAIAWYQNGSPVIGMYLPIEGGAVNGLLDLSGNGHTMTVVGDAAAAWQATGGHDGAGAFMFGSAFYITAGEVFPTSGSYTKMAWVNRAGTGSNNIMSSQDVAGGHVFYASSSQSFRLSAGQVGSWNIVQDPIPLATDVWYHVAVTFDYATSEIILYKDGAPVSTATVPAANKDILDATLHVGAFANSSQWNGRIDEARLYNAVLSPEQILALYHGSDSIKYTETVLGDVWYADVTPFSATEMGTTVSSNSLTIMSDPPAVSGIPDQSIAEGSSFATINLDNYVTDANHTAAEMTWSATGNVELSVSIVDRVATIGILDPDWNGDETITFRATDPDGLYDEDAALFEVTPVNDAPVCGDIPGQVTPQGFGFAPIYLDSYVTDIDNAPSEMTWSCSGMVNLQVIIDNVNNIATIDVVSPDWYGSETVTFYCTDPGNLYDTDAATFTVDADPTVESVVLSATSINPLTTDDLFCDYVFKGNAVTSAVTWYVNGIPQMTLYTPFEAGPTTALLDYSGNANPVTAYGNPTWDSAAGHDGNGAYWLDGNDYFDAGAIFPTQSSYTKAVWLMRTGSGSNNILSGSGSHVFYASSSSQLNRMAAGHNGHYSIVRDPDSLDLNVWVFGVVTFDYVTGEMVLYRDGAEVDRATAAIADREVSDDHLYIGAFAASSQWHGAMDEVRIYDYVLSAGQVLALYNSGDTIHHEETTVLDEWQAEVTPFSGLEVGPTETSNTLLVGYVNQPPELATITEQSVDVARYLSFAVTATEGDPQDPPALGAFSPPLGVQFTDYGDGSGLFEWTPGYDQFGEYSVTIWAQDDSLAYDSQAVLITVYRDSIPPAVTQWAPANDSITTNGFMELNFDFSDENPMTVKLFGGSQPDPTRLLLVQEGVPSNAVDYLWQCPVLTCEEGVTGGIWCLDAGSGTVAADLSSNANNGSLYGGCQWSADGHHGYAIEFDGADDYVEIPDAPSLDIDPATGALTLEAWVYPYAAGDGVMRSIFAKRAYARARTVNYELMLNFDRKLIYSEGEGSSWIWLSDVTVPADEWSYVAFTLDAIGRVGYFYLNGVLADSISDLDIGPSHNGPLFIGAAGAASEPFMGMIDDVTVTRRALSSQELSLREHLTHGLYYWRVEAEDASGNSSMSPISTFGVYSPETVLPATIFPVDAPGTALYEMIPTFTWSEWIGPAPYDTIYYRIHLGLDRAFGFEAVFDSLMATELIWVDSLEFAKQYWWKVDGWAETDTGLISTTSAVDSFWTWALGDLNTDHSVDVSDLTQMVSFMFAGGEPLSPPFIGDINGSCTVDISDLTFMVAYFFQGGPAPKIGCE